MKCLLIAGLLDADDFQSLVNDDPIYSICALLMKRSDLSNGWESKLERSNLPEIFCYEDLFDLSIHQNSEEGRWAGKKQSGP